MVDYYAHPEEARSLGLLGPTIMRSAQAVHARELARQMMSGGVPGYKRGGFVRKTGLAVVHKGERVLNRKQAKSYSRPSGRR